MKVVVTGGNGYIGRALRQRIEHITDIEGEFITVDHDPEFPYTDFSVESLTGYFMNADVVIHLAAVRGGSEISLFNANSQITEHVMIAAAAAGVRRFIFVSSIAVYSDLDMLPWCENQPCTPVSLYGISKVTCENICKYYAKKNGINGVILRFAPIYGENDKNKRMIANFVRQAAGGEEITVKGKSVSERDFLYLQDAVSALIFAMNMNNEGVTTVNIGSGQKLTNYEIASTIVKAMNSSSRINYIDSVSENMPPAYMDLTKASELGYQAEYDMETAMKKVAESYRG